MGLLIFGLTPPTYTKIYHLQIMVVILFSYWHYSREYHREKTHHLSEKITMNVRVPLQEENLHHADLKMTGKMISCLKNDMVEDSFKLILGILTLTIHVIFARFFRNVYLNNSGRFAEDKVEGHPSIPNCPKCFINQSSHVAAT